jgi:Lon protease-like protein
MTRDALGGERLIGMIQPSDPTVGGMNPPVYPVGCAGRITQFSETDDGRFLITLTGVSRFRVVEELPLLSGYRRILPDWKPFDPDREIPDAPQFDRARLIRGLKTFFGQRQLSADWSAIEKAPAEQLIASIAMACPFAPSEKQALLEAADLEQRAALLTGLVEMAAIQPVTGEDDTRTRH